MTHWLRVIPIKVFERELYVNLIILDKYDYLIILRIDFLSKYNATIESCHRRVTFKLSDNDEFSFVGEDQRKQKMIISSMSAQKMLLSVCQEFLTSVVDTTLVEKSKLEDIPIIREFLDVFLEEFPGLPPDRAISFEIELLPGTSPVYKAPYRMALAKLKELQVQLQELLDKGFIRLSYST